MQSAQPDSNEPPKEELQPSQIPESPPVKTNETLGNTKTSSVTVENNGVSLEQPQPSSGDDLTDMESSTAPPPTNEPFSDKPTCSSEGVVDHPSDSVPDPSSSLDSETSCMLTVPTPVSLGSTDVLASADTNKPTLASVTEYEIPLETTPNSSIPSSSIQSDATVTMDNTKEVDQTPPLATPEAPVEQLTSNSETDSNVTLPQPESTKCNTRKRKKNKKDTAGTPAPVGTGRMRKRKLRSDAEPEEDTQPSLKQKRDKTQETSSSQEDSSCSETPLSKKRKRTTPKQVIKKTVTVDPRVVVIDSPAQSHEDQTTPTLPEEPPARKKRKTKEKNQSPPSTEPKQSRTSPIQLPVGCQIQVPQGTSITKDQLNAALCSHFRTLSTVTCSNPSTVPLTAISTSSQTLAGSNIALTYQFSSYLTKLMEQIQAPGSAQHSSMTSRVSPSSMNALPPGQATVSQMQNNPLLNNNQGGGNLPQASSSTGPGTLQTSGVRMASRPGSIAHSTSSVIATPLPPGLTLSQIGGQVGTANLWENIRLLKAFLSSKSPSPSTGGVPLPTVGTLNSSNITSTQPTQTDTEDPLPTANLSTATSKSVTGTLSEANALKETDKPSEDGVKEPEGTKDADCSSFANMNLSESEELSLKPSEDSSGISPQELVNVESSLEKSSGCVEERSGSGEVRESSDITGDHSNVIPEGDENNETSEEVAESDRMEDDSGGTVTDGNSGSGTEGNVSGSLVEGQVQGISGSNAEVNIPDSHAENIGPESNAKTNISESQTKGPIQQDTGSSDETEVCPKPSIPSLVHLASVAMSEINKVDGEHTASLTNLSQLEPFPRLPISTCSDQMEGDPDTPPSHPQDDASPKQTPIGILKHISQFDTPVSATKVENIF